LLDLVMHSFGMSNSTFGIDDSLVGSRGMNCLGQIAWFVYFFLLNSSASLLYSRSSLLDSNELKLLLAQFGG
jgi:hypothetical protein